MRVVHIHAGARAALEEVPAEPVPSASAEGRMESAEGLPVKPTSTHTAAADAPSTTRSGGSKSNGKSKSQRGRGSSKK